MLLMLRWHGHTSFLESLYIIPGGFGNGIALSATFVGLTAALDPSQIAVASSGLYLSSNIGNVAGLSVGSAVLQTTLQKQLRIALEGHHKREEVRGHEKLQKRMAANDLRCRSFIRLFRISNTSLL